MQRQWRPLAVGCGACWVSIHSIPSARWHLAYRFSILIPIILLLIWTLLRVFALCFSGPLNMTLAALRKERGSEGAIHSIARGLAKKAGGIPLIQSVVILAATVRVPDIFPN